MCGDVSLFTIIFFWLNFATTWGNSVVEFKRKKYTGCSYMPFSRKRNILMLTKMESFMGGEKRTLKSGIV